MWNLVGTPSQNALVQQALDRCDFDFTKCLPSLAREGKTSVRVEWADLSRYRNRMVGNGAGHEHEDGVHPIEREVEGRMHVLGLFYLPPHTKIVLDLGLERTPTLAQEVFLAEGAHCVDYHYMTAEHRRLFTNSVHTEQLSSGADTSDGATFRLDGHTCSWFDVNSYAWWVGEAFMEGFIEATSDVPVTINLAHPVGAEDRSVIRQFLGIDVSAPEPPPEPEPAGRVYRARPHSKVVHDAHRGQEPTEWFASLSDAEAVGLRACRVCRPRA
jgi:hypothetical protein